MFRREISVGERDVVVDLSNTRYQFLNSETGNLPKLEKFQPYTDLMVEDKAMETDYT